MKCPCVQQQSFEALMASITLHHEKCDVYPCGTPLLPLPPLVQYVRHENLVNDEIVHYQQELARQRDIIARPHSLRPFLGAEHFDALMRITAPARLRAAAAAVGEIQGRDRRLAKFLFFVEYSESLVG